MSKEDFPENLTSEKVLLKTFEFIDDWKLKLFAMISGDLPRLEIQVIYTFCYEVIFNYIALIFRKTNQ